MAHVSYVCEIISSTFLDDASYLCEKKVVFYNRIFVQQTRKFKDDIAHFFSFEDHFFSNRSELSWFFLKKKKENPIQSFFLIQKPSLNLQYLTNSQISQNRKDSHRRSKKRKIISLVFESAYPTPSNSKTLIKPFPRSKSLATFINNNPHAPLPP